MLKAMKIGSSQLWIGFILNALTLACSTVIATGSYRWQHEDANAAIDGIISPTGGTSELTDVFKVDPHKDQQEMLLTASAKQLLRRERPEGTAAAGLADKSGVHDTCSDCEDQLNDEKGDGTRLPNPLSAIMPHNLLVDLHDDSDDMQEVSRSAAANNWQVVSTGDAQALTINDGVIYIVGHETKLPILQQAIYKQPLSYMTPYSNWTLVGWGSMSSIAVHNSKDQGKIMYGVGASNWLYRQSLDSMPVSNIWQVASYFRLSAISIDGDNIYGVSPDNPRQVFRLDCRIFGKPYAEVHGWYRVTHTGAVKSLSIVGSSIFAIFMNGMVYNKTFATSSSVPLSVDPENSTLVDHWTIRNHANMLSVAVLGDTIYGVSPQHKVCRVPVIVNKRWTRIASGSMVSLAINAAGDTIYAASSDGQVYKQDLLTMHNGSAWLEASMPTVTSIAIQGQVIYGVSYDKTVVKQVLDTMTPFTEWVQAADCCVEQIAASDGIIYAVKADSKIYSQSDVLMNPLTTWILAANGPVKSISIRGDIMYGISPDGLTQTMRLGYLNLHVRWAPTDIETKDPSYPAKKYVSILAHNDIMYACGEEQDGVYSKLIDDPVTYPPGLTDHGNTHDQAYYWNLTDLWHQPGHNLTSDEFGQSTQPGQPTLPELRKTTTTVKLYVPAAVSSDTQPLADSLPVSDDAGVAPVHLDRYRDLNSSAIHNVAFRHAHVNIWLCPVLCAVVVLCNARWN